MYKWASTSSSIVVNYDPYINTNLSQNRQWKCNVEYTTVFWDYAEKFAMTRLQNTEQI